ncbi:hypothetical protein T11_14617 [Trichinella zimbabwensis]|uniref:Uncharacterized protein n=1 Tax=Trichinella zimbabwensis TaxID=268475 RepID=A0A0V1HL41_9BILA|nr:hypothetical protein T11_14617 [Trichinella zimbabwensis]
MTELLYLKAEALQTELEENLEEEEMRRASEDWSRYWKTFRQRKAKERALIRQLQLVQDGQSVGADHASLPGQSAHIGNGKLPELRLPQFSGEVLDFPPFWAYTSVQRDDSAEHPILAERALLVPEVPHGAGRGPIFRFLPSERSVVACHQGKVAACSAERVGLYEVKMKLAQIVHSCSFSAKPRSDNY